MKEGAVRTVLHDRVVALMGGIGGLTAALPAVAQACAVCVGSSAEDQGYFWGVLFLMAMPFLVTGSVGGWLLYHHRRSRGAPLSTSGARHVD